ncbi:MAG: porin, partial [Mesorhizobium sp.]
FDGASSVDHQDGDEQDTWYKQARFTLKTWTGQETELGTLKTFTETRFNFGNRNTYGIEDNPATLADETFSNPAGNKGVSLNFA